MGAAFGSIINIRVTTDIVYLPLPYFTEKWTYDESPVTIKATKPNRKEDVLCPILKLCFCIMAVQYGIHNPTRIAYCKSDFMREGMHDFVERPKECLSDKKKKHPFRRSRSVSAQKAGRINA